jgi:hypothetical protein
MSDPFSPSNTRVYLNVPPFLRRWGCGGWGMGCMGMVVALFVIGGLIGLLLLGWQTLLNYH